MEKKRIFADGMESVSLTEGMIRMELFCFTPKRSNDDKTPAEHEVTGELLMTPQGFLRAYGAMENLIKQLQGAGIIKRNDGTQQDIKITSPNFN